MPSALGRGTENETQDHTQSADAARTDEPPKADTSRVRLSIVETTPRQWITSWTGYIPLGDEPLFV